MNTENLTFLGFDDWFLKNKEQSKQNEFDLARIAAVNKNNYLIKTADTEIIAELSGKFIFTADSHTDYPVTGDWVYIQNLPGENFSIIHELFPRKNLLKRKTAGKKADYQLIAANIDNAIIMQSLDTDYNIRRLERYLLMINDSNIEPVLFFSKRDLLSVTEIEEKKNKILEIYPFLKIITFSNNIESDINVIKNLFQPKKTYCLLGSSGVGKSTLLNNLIHKDLYKTQAVREKDGRGKHTTTRRELIIIENGSIIIDTPGMRELGIIGVEQGFENTFNEISELITRCRFKDCTHTVEDGCAIRQALDSGELSRERYQNYRKIYKESLYNEMSYVERRQKDKKFGKYVHSVLKHKKDKQ